MLIKTCCRVGVVSVVLALAGCGGDDSAAKSTSSQVAAKVNSAEITVRQINSVMGNAAGLNEAQAKDASKRALAGLIDQELLVQKAIEKKMDRSPEILLALENARRTVLSRAYLELRATEADKPTPEQIREFYDAKPELFKERRIYRLQELATVLTPNDQAVLEKELRKMKSLNEVAQWLRSRKIPFNGDGAVRAAEQLPMELSARLAKMAPGQIMTSSNGKGAVRFVQVAGVEPMPVAEKDAAPMIERYLSNQKRGEIAQSEMKMLRESAKIEYVGSFAALQSDPAQTAVQPVSVTTPGDARSKADTFDAASGKNASTKSDESVLERGISGLR